MNEILKLKRPLIFLDLETTGKYINIDRIVEISTIKLHPNGTEVEKTVRVNPTIPISKGAFEIHGISNQDVANKPTFAEHSKSIFEFIQGCDLAGYNLLRFDLPLLQKEFELCGIKLDISDRSLIDPMVIFHRKEPRDLSAAYQKYCGKIHEGAHQAIADARATKEILLNQIEFHPDIGETVQELHSFSNPIDPDAIDTKGFFLNSDRGPQLAKGKYAGRLVSEIANSDGSYLEWVLRTSNYDPKIKEVINRFN